MSLLPWQSIRDIRSLERYEGSFLRSFTLPADSDGTAIHPSCQDGQLSITVLRKAVTTASIAFEVPVQ